MTTNISPAQESHMSDCPHSLKWHLIARLTTLQTALLMSLAVLIMGALWLTGCLAKLSSPRTRPSTPSAHPSSGMRAAAWP